MRRNHGENRVGIRQGDCGAEYKDMEEELTLTETRIDKIEF